MTTGIAPARSRGLKAGGRFVPMLLGLLLLGAAPAPAGQVPTGGGSAAGSQSGLTATLLRELEADVQAAMQTYQAVGAAVALVQGNQIVYSRGFGVRDER